MKFLHITIPSKRMMETYIKMIRDNYPEEEHTFYFLSKCPPSEKCLFDYGNVFELDEGTSKITKIKNFYNDLNKYDYIIWHGLVLSPKFALFLNIARWFLKKSIWVMWGIDLYSFRRERNGIKNRIINYLNYNIRKSIAYPVAIFPTDIDMYKRIFNSNKQVYYAPYPIRSSVFEDMESASDVMPRKNGEIWIQIGNNANSFNRHFDIIDALSKFAQEKIKVFIPMSYGNDWHNRENNYIDNVRERAIEIFGEDKVFVLKNLMSIEEYSRFLQQIDIMIIATDRQNALGNILKNMYCGGKTYLSEKNKLFSYFKSIGVKIQSFEDIKDKSFEEFISLVDNSNIKNWMIENHYPDMNINFWDNLFSSLKHHETGIEIKSKVVVKDSNEILNNIKCNSKVHEKKNYINLDRFLYKNKIKVKKISNAKNVFIIGTDDSCIKIAQSILHDNDMNFKWNIMGILSDEMEDIGNKAYGVNTVSTIRNCHDYSTVYCINFIDDSKRREGYYNAIKSLGGSFSSVCLFNSSVPSDISYEEAFYLGTNSIIGHSCRFGKFVKIGHNTIIGCNCIIGNYVTIGDNLVIPNGTIIKDYSTLQ